MLAADFVDTPCARTPVWKVHHRQPAPFRLLTKDASPQSLGNEAVANFVFAQSVVRGLGEFVNSLDNFISGGNAVAFEPEYNVGFAAHRAHVDNLLESKQMRRHAGIDGIGEFDVILLIGLDDRSGMDSGGRAESVFADHGIIWRDRNAGRAGYRDTVIPQLGQVLLVPRRYAH